MFKQIGSIGYGNMGQAFLSAIHSAYPAVRFTVLEKDPAKADKAKKECNAHIVSTIEEILEHCDSLLLAIKPQDAAELLTAIRKTGVSIPILSILGGKTISWITETSGIKQVARYMPSLSATVGKGAIALSFNPDENDHTFSESARKVAAAVGTVYPIPEKLMSAFTGISGSGIAYAWTFIHAMAMGGVQSGISYQDSLAIVCDMISGAAETIRSNGEHPVSLVSKVCSPGGTTIEGISVLDNGGFSGLCMNAVVAACKKSQSFE